MPPHRSKDPATSIAAYLAKLMIREREKAGMTQAEVASRLLISPKLYGHFENVRRTPSLDALQRLDGLHGYEDIELFAGLHDHLLRELDLPAEILEYFEQEALAAKIQIYAPLIIPGLFQTENYAREVLRTWQPEDRLERVVASRLSRQELLDRDDPPYVVAVIKENVLREVVGGPEVMREQLAHLLKLRQRPNVTIHVIPAGAPVYASGTFTLLTYSEGGEIVYVEGAAGVGNLIERATKVHELGLWFDMIRSHALSSEDTEKLINSIMESM
jgi:transcriptional regulator with XRE-family HTH domain